MCSAKRVWLRMGPSGTPSLNGNWIFLWRLPIQNNLKPSNTEKRRNKVKYLIWMSIRLKSVKKTSWPNPVKGLGYIKFYSSKSPDLLKCLEILSDITLRGSAVDREDLKPDSKSEKKCHISLGDQQPYYWQAFESLPQKTKKLKLKLPQKLTTED